MVTARNVGGGPRAAGHAAMTSSSLLGVGAHGVAAHHRRMGPDGTPLPELPEPVPVEALRQLEDAGLAAIGEALSAAERGTIAAMAPYDRQLRELKARSAEVATEVRRRERAQRHAARIAVREQAGSETMPSVTDLLGAGLSPLPDERPLGQVRAFLRSGGEVGFGFATKPGWITFTDGRRSAQAASVGEARRLWAEGWEPGAPGVGGVRVHLVGTRVERLVSADDVVVSLEPAPSPA